MRSNFKAVPFRNTTQKIIYGELIKQKSTTHKYQIKWISTHRQFFPLEWTNIWASLHEQFFTEEVKTTIWEQIHLNFYTTYNYNKWHNSLLPCPLCRKIPNTACHILLDCSFTKIMWTKINNKIRQIIPVIPEKYEQVFGLQPLNTDEADAVTLRNWVTFTLRHLIMKEERRAYHTTQYSKPQIKSFIQKFNYHMTKELTTKHLQYKFQGHELKFEAIATASNALGARVNNDLVWMDIM